MSSLHDAADGYLALRRALGFKLTRHARLLPALVEHLQAAGQTTVTTALAVEWAARPAGRLHECTARLQVARGFARYLRTLDGIAEVPPTRLLAPCPSRRIPYLYTEQQIASLLDATSILRPAFRAATYRTLLGLLAVTGMRVGEAIALDRPDVDLHAGSVTVRAGKFGAARQLPLHATTVEALADYDQLRGQRRPRPGSPAFFVSTKGTRLHHGNVHRAFQDLLATAGIRATVGGRRPRIHDLRHTFAVNTLVDWYRADGNVAAKIPRLSDYLGHAAPAGTYWYLQATPELLAFAARRLEHTGGQR
jgi:integrase